MAQIRNFFRSDFSKFCLCHLEPIWTTFVPNLTTLSITLLHWWQHRAMKGGVPTEKALDLYYLLLITSTKHKSFTRYCYLSILITISTLLNECMTHIVGWTRRRRVEDCTYYYFFYYLKSKPYFWKTTCVVYCKKKGGYFLVTRREYIWTAP